jgi:hypothetical protein
MRVWADFSACRWGPQEGPEEVTRRFLAQNGHYTGATGQTLISFSHFLPRIDLMPSFVSPHTRELYPVFGTTHLDEQVRRLGSNIHLFVAHPRFEFLIAHVRGAGFE